MNPQISLSVDTDNERVIVHATFKNASETETYFFEPWQLFRDNLLEGSLLQVSQNGHKIDFLGPMVKRRAATDKDLIKLPPGQTLQAQQDITTQYRFTPGTNTYTATYAAFIREGVPTKYVTVSSQPTTFTLTR